MVGFLSMITNFKTLLVIIGNTLVMLKRIDFLTEFENVDGV